MENIKKNQEKLACDIHKTIILRVTKEIQCLKKLFLIKIYNTLDVQFILCVDKPEEKENFSLTITANALDLVYLLHKAANALNLVYLEYKAGIFAFLIVSIISILVFTYVTSKYGNVLKMFYIPLIYRDG